jgi:hypothetical protein
MEGEFFSHDDLIIEGGHAMNLVGFNDQFELSSGDVGALIIKNSWSDSKYSGSHSMQYYMQNISRWDESRICPNSYNARNWYQCGDNTMAGFRDGCLSKETKLFAELSRKPLNFTCVAHGCSQDLVYYLKNMTAATDDKTKACFYGYSAINNTVTDYCFPSFPIDYLQYMMEPIVTFPNCKDRCGFYAMSYKTVHQWKSLFQSFFTNSFDIKWEAQSFAANAAKFPALNYTLIKQSTRTQHDFSNFNDSPFPTVV